ASGSCRWASATRSPSPRTTTRTAARRTVARCSSARWSTANPWAGAPTAAATSRAIPASGDAGARGHVAVRGRCPAAGVPPCPLSSIDWLPPAQITDDADVPRARGRVRALLSGALFAPRADIRPHEPPLRAPLVAHRLRGVRSPAGLHRALPDVADGRLPALLGATA